MTHDHPEAEQYAAAAPELERAASKESEPNCPLSPINTAAGERKGYRGVAAAGEMGDVAFIVVTSDEAALELLWERLGMPVLERHKCRESVVCSAKFFDQKVSP